MTDVDRSDQAPRWPGDTRGDFLPGNRASVGNVGPMSHGAWSERRVAPVADQLLATLADDVAADPELAHLTRPIFRPALLAWARCEARVALLVAWLEDRADGTTPGDLDSEGEVRPAADLLTRLETQAARHRQALGLDPASLARLRRDAGSARVAFDLAALLANLDHDNPKGDDDAGT